MNNQREKDIQRVANALLMKYDFDGRELCRYCGERYKHDANCVVLVAKDLTAKQRKPKKLDDVQDWLAKHARLIRDGERHQFIIRNTLYFATKCGNQIFVSYEGIK